MRRIFLILIAVTFSSLASSAQTEDVVSAINAIKLDREHYFYGENTASEEKEAYLTAIEQLCEEAGVQAIDTALTNRYIHTRAGGMTRCFVYLAKSDIMPEDVDLSDETDVTQKSLVTASELEALLKNVTSIALVERLVVSARIPATDHGRLTGSVPQSTIDECYLIIYGNTGKVNAILAPAVDGLKLNILTGNKYLTGKKDVGYYWIKL